MTRPFRLVTRRSRRITVADLRKERNSSRCCCCRRCCWQFCWFSSFQNTRSSAIAEITGDAWNGRSRSLKVIRCCVNRGGIYYFLILALNSNLTSIFNRSWSVTLSLHIHTAPLFQVELEKDGCEYLAMFGVRVPRTFDYPTINLNPRKSAPYDHNARPFQTDRRMDGQTDKHHGRDSF